MKTITIAAVIYASISAANAQSRCPAGTPPDICKAAQAEAKKVQDEDLYGVMTVRNSPEERFKTVPCYYRVTEAIEVRITRCESRKQDNSQPKFVGRWYLDDPEVCRNKAGEVEGLIEYTRNRFLGYESVCSIRSAKPSKNGYDMRAACSGEGEEYTIREHIQVTGNVLRRTYRLNGKPQGSSLYRCPG